jgi:hypothetical protein
MTVFVNKEAARNLAANRARITNKAVEKFLLLSRYHRASRWVHRICEPILAIEHSIE